MEGKKKLRNQFSLTKRAVRLVLMNADSFPLASSHDGRLLKKDVFAIACAAEERIRSLLRFPAKARITRSTLEKQAGLRELEQTLKLPANTPNDWRKFFKN